MKNLILLIITLYTASSVLAQLPIIYATGGFETEKKWNDWVWEVQTEGPGFYGDCADFGEGFNPSSTLAPQGKKNYSIGNISDLDPFTAWIPEGNGIGESFEFRHRPVTGSGTIYFSNGYQSSSKTWKENSRIKKFKVYKNGKPIFFMILADKMGYQELLIPEDLLSYKEGDNTILKFEIAEVYKGTKYTDVAISDIFYSGCCFLGDTLILGWDEANEIKTIENGFPIIVFDPQTGLSNTTRIEKKASQVHDFLIKVSTQTKSITLTPGHPLYVKDYGFISLKELKFKLGLKDYEELAVKLELLTHDSKTGKTVYETLQSVKPKEGRFETFTIQKLKDGESYIANGFVTKTY